MNLWAKRIGQLAVLAVALFFLSCQEETSVLGYRNPNSKFKVSYVEIPIGSSVLLRDSMRTANFRVYGEPNRLLVGKYTDEAFGDVSASAFTQFFTNSRGKMGSSAVFDSVTLQLRFDLYHYGGSTTTPQVISVYELERELKFDSLNYYYNKTNIPHSSVLGTKTFSINPEDFDDFAASSTNSDTVITIRLPLDFSFGQRIFNSAYQYSTTTTDTTFVTYNQFIKEFYGIAIKPETTDKLVGLNITSATSESRITIHFHETDKDSLSLVLPLSGVSFNQIKSDRSATELSGVNQYYQEYLQDSENRYIQSGVGILTKLDFSKFYEFADTVPYVLINSAELVIESVQSSSYAPPASLSLRVLDDNNRMKTFSPVNEQDGIDYTSYNGNIRFDIALPNNQAPIVDNDSVFYAIGDRSPVLGYSGSNNSYSAVMSLFFQQLTLENDERTKFTSFVLYPTSTSVPTGAKTVNRVIFPKDKIKLKVYYTKPTTQR